MVYLNHREFEMYCEHCENTRPVSKHWLLGSLQKIVCRACGKVLALEGGESNGQEG